jgi:hypothetical protein
LDAPEQFSFVRMHFERAPRDAHRAEWRFAIGHVPVALTDYDFVDESDDTEFIARLLTEALRGRAVRGVAVVSIWPQEMPLTVWAEVDSEGPPARTIEAIVSQTDAASTAAAPVTYDREMVAPSAVAGLFALAVAGLAVALFRAYRWPSPEEL